MKKRLFLLPSLLLALAVFTAGATEGEAPNPDADPNIEATVSSEKNDSTAANSASLSATVIDPVKLNDRVTKLEEQVTELKKDVENSGTPTFWIIMLSLVCGAIGGAAITVFLLKKGVKNPFEKAAPENTVKPQPYVRPQSADRQQNVSVSSSPAKKPQKSETEKSDNMATDNYSIENSRRAENPSQRKQATAQSVKPADSTLVAYGDITIADANMMYIEDTQLKDSGKGLPFKFNINRTKNTATFTINPEVLGTVLSRLSSFEPFVEGFEFTPSATVVTVKNPGSLVRRDGYWQVEKRITISLS